MQSYDSASGVAVVSPALSHYHYGAPQSTAGRYNVDVRGEVLILSRNVQILAHMGADEAGNQLEAWGGQVVTSTTVETTFVEQDGALVPLFQQRRGHTVLQNVEIHNCSQADTQKAALRFESALGNWSRVHNSSIHNGHGWAVAIKASESITLSNNVIFGFRQFGIGVLAVENFTLDGNVIAHIEERESTGAQNHVDARGVVAICSIVEGQRCVSLTIVNNIVAGGAWAGFLVPGHTCGDGAQTLFRNNVAHSMAGESGGGYGAVIYPDPHNAASPTCFEASYFTAYKCT